MFIIINKKTPEATTQTTLNTLATTHMQASGTFSSQNIKPCLSLRFTQVQRLNAHASETIYFHFLLALKWKMTECDPCAVPQICEIN